MGDAIQGLGQSECYLNDLIKSIPQHNWLIAVIKTGMDQMVTAAHDRMVTSTIGCYAKPKR